jgi:hypothetical protein
MADTTNDRLQPGAVDASGQQTVRQPSAAAGTLARDANEVKATPYGWIRERVHVGDGHFVWSEPFDPMKRAAEENEIEQEKLRLRGAMSESDLKGLTERVHNPPAPEPEKK